MRIGDVVDKQRLAELYRTNNYRALWDFSLRVLGQSALFLSAIFYLGRAPVLSVLLFYACAVWHSFWGYAGIGHELYHARVFSSVRLNKWLYRWASYLTWNNPAFFEKSHGYHHSHTFARDDGEAASLQNWSPMSVFFYLTVDFPLMYRRLLYALINSFGITIRAGKYARVERQSQIDAILMMAINAALQCGLYFLFRSLLVNLYWFLLPFTGLFFNRLLAQSQHIGLADYAGHGPLKHSRTLVLPGLIEFLYAGMNFHAEHHFAPGVPYYKLPQLHALLKDKRLVFPCDGGFLLHDIWTEIRQMKADHVNKH